MANGNAQLMTNAVAICISDTSIPFSAAPRLINSFRRLAAAMIRGNSSRQRNLASSVGVLVGANSGDKKTVPLTLAHTFGHVSHSWLLSVPMLVHPRTSAPDRTAPEPYQMEFGK